MSIKYILPLLSILIILSAVSAHDLDEYPDFFIEDDEVNVIIVVGDNAPASHVLAQTQIALSLSKSVSRQTKGITKLASEVNDTKGKNIISIGNSCINDVTKAILGDPQPCKAERPSIQLIGIEDEKGHIVLNANTEAEIKELAEILSEYDENDLEGMSFEIETEPDSGSDDGNETKEDDDGGEEDDVESLKEIEDELEEESDILEEETDEGRLTDEETEDETAQEEEKQEQQAEKENFIKKFFSWLKSLFS